MRTRQFLIAGAAVAILLAAGQFLQGADQSTGGAPAVSQRIIIKLCNWDGVVPEQALDGFAAPGGKWAEYQCSGWRVESYLVAPNEGGQKNGLYAVLMR